MISVVRVTDLGYPELITDDAALLGPWELAKQNGAW
jgi:hypothetical protein